MCNANDPIEIARAIGAADAHIIIQCNRIESILVCLDRALTSYEQAQLERVKQIKKLAMR